MHPVTRILCTLLVAGAAHADNTSGVDAALFRSAYDANGIFSVEGARLLPTRDLSLKLLAGYSHAPLQLTMPGFGQTGVLDYVATLDMAFGMTLTDRVALGFNVGAYRTATAPGYGVRGRYGSGGTIDRASTGLIALRPLSNIDPSADPGDGTAYLGDGLAGPLDARAGVKLNLLTTAHAAVTLVGSVILPFGEDEMLLGDRDLVFEPRLAVDWRKDRVSATRVVANVGARLRHRTVLESYDPASETPTDAQVILDVGSELVLGAGAVIELAPRVALGVEAVAFVPLPEAASLGECTRYSGARCSSLRASDYVTDATRGDLTVLATAGAQLRVTADVTAQLMVGTGQLGIRGDEVRTMIGLVWAPQPVGAAAPGRNDRDGDGVPDSLDACVDEPEDRDGFQDEDGCPDADNDGDGIADANDKCPDEPEDKDGFEDDDGCREQDNDSDGILDTTDRCPDQPEDRDGFEDDDGCPDADNDNDGFVDEQDKCPNDAETVNGVDDDDGCPDVRQTQGPEERADRIDLKGAQITFTRTSTLTPAAKQLLAQVATLIKNRKLAIRVEVHLALGTRGTTPAAITARKRVDKQVAQARAKAIGDYLVAQGVPAAQLTLVGVGSDRPLVTPATSPDNDRIELLKGGAP